MKGSRVILLVLLFFLTPGFLYAQVAQIVFTTNEQTIEPGEISEKITIQLQDAEGNSFQTTETVDLVFSSDSSTGEFLSPSTTTPVTTTMASGTANKNFRYRDSTAGNFTLTINATGRTSGNTWSATQTIAVLESVPTLPTVSVFGSIATSTVWSNGNVYVLENVVTVPAGITLTIEPGAIIKGRHGGAGMLEVFGNLSAVGTEESPIYLTSLLDDSIGGDSDATGSTTGAMKDWVGIYFKADSTGNMDYMTVRNAGYIGVGSNTGIENNGGDVTINNSTITNNYLRGVNNRSGSLSITGSVIENHHYGVQAEGGELSIEKTIVRNNSEAGIDAYGAQVITLIDNTFSSNQKLGRINTSAEFTHSGNTSSDVTNRGFEMTGTVTRNTVWDTGSLPFIIPASSIVWVGASSTLTISPGSIVKFGSSAAMIVEGTLDIDGVEDSEVYLTSLKDDSVSGDTNNDGTITTPASQNWNGIEFWSGSTGEISHTIIRYTGGVGPSGNGNRSAVYNLGGSVLLNNIAFSDNYVNDVYQSAGSTTISHSTFSSNTNPVLSNVGTSTLDARLNWWSTATGPAHSSNATGTGPIISDNVLFDPWIKRDPALPNPVIIVPGIVSSKLNRVGSNFEAWLNIPQMISSITDVHLDELTLNGFGEEISSHYPDSILKNIGDFDFFNGLYLELGSEGYAENGSLFDLPYDWRKDIDVSALSLKEKIDEVKTQTGAEEVDLVVHSMGGLVVKKYLKDYGGDSIGKFIDIGTPHTGSPKSFKVLNYGDNFGFEKFGINFLNLNRSKIISQNMPAVYQLLPSENYFDDSDPNYRYYVFNGIDGNDRLTFEETADYLKSEGRNELLVDRADEFHQEIDDLDPADYGVETYNIVGCGTPTIGQFYILGKEGDKYIYNIKMINGDGTVPLKSAEALAATQTYYVKNAQHALMPSTSGVKELVASILTGDNFSISSYSNLAANSNGCQIPNGKLVSFHSPIELHIYDESGNHTGPDENGDIENEVDGVVYEVIDDNKFAYLPDGTEYVVKGSATDTGTFDTRIQEVVDGEVVTTTIFSDIPLTLTTQVNFDIGSDIPDQVYLDHDGDEVFESSQAVSTTTAGFLESTGKEVIASVVESDSSPESTSSKVQPSIEIPVVVEESFEVVATSTQLVQPAPSPVLSPPIEHVLGESVVQSDPSAIVEEVPEVIKSPPESGYENTAVVYKSFGYKVINFFKSIWSWIISKL
ncbi:MAG: alpha/beta hydrolase [Candidatus Zambryskibacteria bacterium]|nr:alpha/beta hydrolase [Candidatus Zambryskibacteria bacterium]